MGYPMLQQIKRDLLQKQERDPKEDALLNELISLGDLIGKTDFSLAMSSGVCPTCGRSLGK